MKYRKILLASVTMLGLAGCAEQPYTGPDTITHVQQSGYNSNINGSYGNSRLDAPEKQIPTLSDMENIQPTHVHHFSKKEELKVPAIREQALAYGARGGLAYASQQINHYIEEQAPQLTKTYDFNRFLIHQHGETILPPVIVEQEDTYEQGDDGETLRVADRYYKIEQQAQFAPIAPLWRTYLRRVYDYPTRPTDDVIPQNQEERNVWIQYVSEGWEQGAKQAKDMFKQDLRRLDRDYQGMIRYSQLLEEGKVSEPLVAGQSFGATGNGQDMRENDRVYRMTRKPHLNVDRPSDWKPAVSDINATEAATPPGVEEGSDNDGHGY